MKRVETTSKKRIKETWTSVNKVLPKFGKEVNVITSFGKVTSLVRYPSSLDSKRYHWRNDEGQGIISPMAITHWRDLPKGL